MKNTILILLSGILSAQANTVVSWNVNVYGDAPTGSSPTAGVVPVSFWNDTYLDGLPNPANNLRDSTGAASSIDISWVALNTYAIQFNSPGPDANGTLNKQILNGYLNAGQNQAPNSSSVTLSQIGYSSYDVYVYFSSDVADREGSVTDGTSTYYFRTLGPAARASADAILTQTTDTVDDVQDGLASYAVFSGLSGATKTLSVNIPTYGGIAAIQIVNTGTLPPNPVFVVQPEDDSVPVGSNVTLSSSAPADPAPTYQWEYSVDGESGWTQISGETDASLSIIYVTLADVGYYRVIATNDNDSATSDFAYLDVYYLAPEFYEQPSPVYAVEGSNAELIADAATYGTPSYQWFKDGNPLAGKTDYTLSLTNLGAADEGVYFLRVTDGESGLSSDSKTAKVVTFVAWSGLASSDPFDTAAGYTLGELPLQNPAIDGYDGPWTDVDFGEAEPEVQSGSLSYPNPLYLGSSGAKVAKAADIAGISGENSGRAFRKLLPALATGNNTTGARYLSFLYQNGNENAAGNAYTNSTLALYQDTGGGNPSGDAARRTFEAGISDADFGSTNFGFRYNDALVGNLGVPVDSNVHLFVVKFDLSASSASDSITVWLDPTLGSGDPTGGVTLSNVNVNFDSLSFSDYASNSMAWDEVRWGSDFNSVTLGTNTGDTYASWIALYPVGSETGFGDDPDHDGLQNGLENYFGTNPSTSSTGITQVGKSGNTLTFQHPQNATPATDLSAGYQWSTDLTTWLGSGVSNGTTTVSLAPIPNTPTTGTTTVTATISGTVPAKVFVRIGVVLAP